LIALSRLLAVSSQVFTVYGRKLAIAVGCQEKTDLEDLKESIIWERRQLIGNLCQT
jgi:hypothetical protein